MGLNDGVPVSAGGVSAANPDGAYAPYNGGVVASAVHEQPTAFDQGVPAVWSTAPYYEPAETCTAHRRDGTPCVGKRVKDSELCMAHWYHQRDKLLARQPEVEPEPSEV